VYKLHYSKVEGWSVISLERAAPENQTKLYSRLPRGCNTICHLIIFDRMKDKCVVTTIAEFERYGSGNSRVTADFLSDLTVGYFCVFQRQITEQNYSRLPHECNTKFHHI